MQTRNGLQRTLVGSIALAALAVGAVACGSDDDGDDAAGDGLDVTIVDVWVREPAEGAANSAAYGTITNNGDDAVTLVGGRVPVTATVEVHETLMADDGTMSMQEREDGFTIEPGATFSLEPGGPHIMMLGIDAAEFTEGFDVTFVFDAGEVTVPAELRAIGADMGDMGDMDHDSMDDGSMDEMDDGSMDDGEMEMDDGAMTEDSMADDSMAEE